MLASAVINELLVKKQTRKRSGKWDRRALQTHPVDQRSPQELRYASHHTEKVRSGLGDYLDKGKEALVRINASLTDLGSRFSFFGCNGVVLLGISLLVICVLALF